jgi:hypothetical protein
MTLKIAPANNFSGGKSRIMPGSRRFFRDKNLLILLKPE